MEKEEPRREIISGPVQAGCCITIGDFTESSLVKTIAGWEGIICGASAVYNSLAQLVNNEFGKQVLPL